MKMILQLGMLLRACPTESSPSLWLTEHSDPRGKIAGQPTQRLLDLNNTNKQRPSPRMDEEEAESKHPTESLDPLPRFQA